MLTSNGNCSLQVGYEAVVKLRGKLVLKPNAQGMVKQLLRLKTVQASSSTRKHTWHFGSHIAIWNMNHEWAPKISFDNLAPIQILCLRMSITIITNNKFQQLVVACELERSYDYFTWKTYWESKRTRQCKEKRHVAIVMLHQTEPHMVSIPKSNWGTKQVILWSALWMMSCFCMCTRRHLWTMVVGLIASTTYRHHWQLGATNFLE